MVKQVAGAGTPGTLPTARWLFAAGLLAIEYVLALLLFDSERLPIAKESGVFALLGEAMPIVIVVATATFLFGGGPARAEMKKVVETFSEDRRTWPWFVAHLIAYGVALGVVVFVFNAGLELRRPWLWVGLWLASGIGALIFLLAAVIPSAAWRPLGRPAARALASGLTIGLLALLAGHVASFLWRPMSRATLVVVSWLLGLTGAEVVSSPADLIVGARGYLVFIDRQCSGYEGIGLVAVMFGAYLFYARKSLRFPAALVLLPVGVILIWTANGFRIAALIAVGAWVSPQIAEGGFHSAAGWLLFCTIVLALIAVSRRSGWFARDGGERSLGLQTPEAAYLLPLMVLLAVGLVTKLFVADFDYPYPARVIAPVIALWWLRRHYGDLRWSWSWRPLLLGLVVFVVWVGLEPRAAPSSARVIPDSLAQLSKPAAALWLTARILGSTLVVPIVEELAFRGYLLRRLIDGDFTAVSPRHFTVSSFLVSSIAFGLLHQRWLAGTIAGMVYAGAQYWRGQTSDAIVAHATTNGLLAAFVVLGGHWHFW